MDGNTLGGEDGIHAKRPLTVTLVRYVLVARVAFPDDHSALLGPAIREAVKPKPHASLA